jgi:hypothetical protein
MQLTDYLTRNPRISSVKFIKFYEKLVGIFPADEGIFTIEYHMLAPDAFLLLLGGRFLRGH